MKGAHMLESVASLTQATFAHAIPIGIGLMGLGVLIGFHELGHFLFCKLFNVATPSFSIGFGPHLLSRTIGETTFSISLIPLGGYVEIAGLAEVGQGDQKSAHLSGDRAFRSKPYYQKFLILSGGILFNIIFALGGLTVLFMRDLPPIGTIAIVQAKPQIGTVVVNSAAATAGLQKGDLIVSVNGVSVDPGAGGARDVLEFLRSNTDQTLTFVVHRAQDDHLQTITLTRPESGPIGIAFELPEHKRQGPIGALKSALRVISAWTQETIGIFRSLLQPHVNRNIGGPIAIIGMLACQAQAQWTYLLAALCFISVNLALMNLIPLPIFDGGQIVWSSIEAIARRSFDNARTIVHIVSAVLVIVLMLLISGRDLCRFFFK